MVRLGVEVEIGVSGLAVHFESVETTAGRRCELSKIFILIFNELSFNKINSQYAVP
jgi:hypothetical protein